MEGTVATLTHKREPLVRTIVLTGISAPGACLAGVVGIHFHRHTPREECFVGKVAMQFGKGPPGGGSIRSPLLLRGLLAMLAPGAFTVVSQIFHANAAVWVLVYHAPTDLVVGRSFQPSLPYTYDDKSSGSGTGAFVLQPLSQACIVVCFGSALFAGIEGGASVQLRGNRQVTLSDIHPDHVLVRFGGRVCDLNLKGHEQVKLLAWPVIPQFGCPNVGIVLHESKMLPISCIGHDHTPGERQDTDLGIFLQAIIPMIVIGQRRSNILRRMVQSLIAFLGDAL